VCPEGSSQQHQAIVDVHLLLLLLLLPRHRYKDAVKECGSALEAVPNSAKALRSRAKALEKQGLYKQALADIQVHDTASAPCTRHPTPAILTTHGQWAGPAAHLHELNPGRGARASYSTLCI
jgi:hypothetical protein